MNMLAQTQLQLMNDLWLALERQELRLAYRLNFRPCRPIVGFEALLRWYHPKQGVLNPDQSFTAGENGSYRHYR